MRGRPVLGVVAGFFFGVFLALLLQQAGIRSLDTLSVFGLPILGIVLGLVLAFFAPFGSRPAPIDRPPPPPPHVPGAEPPGEEEAE